MEGAAAARSTSTKSSTEKADPGRGIKKLLARSARAHTSSKARRLHTVDVRSDIKSGLQKRKRPLLWSPRRRANPFGKHMDRLRQGRGPYETLGQNPIYQCFVMAFGLLRVVEEPPIDYGNGGGHMRSQGRI